ncbi:MAG: serine hydroxymethyltransferase, partial [Fusobacteriaceae bacterium]
YETLSPAITSGIRLGTPALTTRGMKDKEMKKVAELILEVFENISVEKKLEEISKKVEDLCAKFPLYR